MDHLHRELAPISSSAWDAIDEEATSRLVAQLAARKMVDFSGPHGWSHSAMNLGRATAIAAPNDGVAVQRREVAPLVELRAAFTLSRDELDDADRGATDLELGALDEATRSLALAENVAVFHGFEPAGIEGITEHTSHEPIDLGGGTEHYPSAVARATDVLRRAGIAGPYGLALSPSAYTSIVEGVEHGGHLLLDHLRQILEGPLVWAPGVECGVVLSLRGGDFELVCGQDVSIGYASSDLDAVTLYLEESFTFVVHEPDAAVELVGPPRS